MHMAGRRINQGMCLYPFRRQSAASKILLAALHCFHGFPELPSRMNPHLQLHLGFAARESCSRDVGRSRAEGPQRGQILLGLPASSKTHLWNEEILSVCLQGLSCKGLTVILCCCSMSPQRRLARINTNTKYKGMCSAQPAGQQEPGLFGGILGSPLMCLGLFLFFLVTHRCG